MEHTKRKYPVKPEGFKRWCDSIHKDHKLFADIAPMKAFQFKAALDNYYGGRWATIVALIKEAWYLTWRGWVVSAMVWFSDRMGWTKLYFYHETEKSHAHHCRHGSKCSGSPNCANEHCIEDSWPKWFKKLHDKLLGRDDE